MTSLIILLMLIISIGYFFFLLSKTPFMKPHGFTIEKQTEFVYTFITNTSTFEINLLTLLKGSYIQALKKGFEERKFNFLYDSETNCYILVDERTDYKLNPFKESDAKKIVGNITSVMQPDFSLLKDPLLNFKYKFEVEGWGCEPGMYDVKCKVIYSGTYKDKYVEHEFVKDVDILIPSYIEIFQEIYNILSDFRWKCTSTNPKNVKTCIDSPNTIWECSSPYKGYWKIKYNYTVNITSTLFNISVDPCLEWITYEIDCSSKVKVRRINENEAVVYRGFCMRPQFIKTYICNNKNCTIIKYVPITFYPPNYKGCKLYRIKYCRCAGNCYLETSSRDCNCICSSS